MLLSPGDMPECLCSHFAEDTDLKVKKNCAMSSCILFKDTLKYAIWTQPNVQRDRSVHA